MVYLLSYNNSNILFYLDNILNHIYDLDFLFLCFLEFLNFLLFLFGLFPYLFKNYFDNLIDGQNFNIVRIFIYYFQWYVTVIEKGDGNRKYFMVFVLSNSLSYYYRVNGIEDYCNITTRLWCFHVFCKK